MPLQRCPLQPKVIIRLSFSIRPLLLTLYKDPIQVLLREHSTTPIGHVFKTLSGLFSFALFLEHRLVEGWNAIRELATDICRSMDFQLFLTNLTVTIVKRKNYCK